MRFDGGALLAGTAPFWMVALWANFATTLNVSLRALHGRLIARFVARRGRRPARVLRRPGLGAVQMVNAGAALAASRPAGPLLTPLLFLAARRLDGYAR